MLSQQCVVQGEYICSVCVCVFTLMAVRSADSAQWEL